MEMASSGDAFWIIFGLLNGEGLPVTVKRTIDGIIVAGKTVTTWHGVFIRHGVFIGIVLCVCNTERYLSLLQADETSDVAAKEEFLGAPDRIFEKAVSLFFDAKPDKAVDAFDQLVQVQPDCQPGLWQRGLALYNADQYEAGRQQFELHKTVNPNDVENPAWHYLCVARATSPDNARRNMLAVGRDSRVPMKQILSLYQGDGSKEEVLSHAAQGSAQQQRNQLCYAHLYLGLFAEANGDHKDAKYHILRAAGPYSMDHYMGRVAKVHARVRGWLVTVE
jgi:lipoprotein NlpI